MKNNPAFYFIFFGLLTLFAGLFFGVIGGLQYVLPDFLLQAIPFYKTRPLHVTLVITWIFSAAAGGIYYYLPEVVKAEFFSARLYRLHFFLFVFTTLAILFSYFSGKFGGREYLEYPPALAFPVAVSWLLLLINFFKTIAGKIKRWPVYLWMWATGIIGFLFTYLESYLWTLPFFRDNIIRDITVQWKSLGAMVGSWNMLVYGTAFYLMEKISGNTKTAYAPLTFFFYFLGLTNLLFNWGHHTYILPAAPWIKYVSYVISMTELLILGNIILNWRKTLSTAAMHYYFLPYRFLMAADIWIFLNLALALVISIPEINFYSHGTHITVAHAMGTTIGINTMILLASCFYIVSKDDENFFQQHHKIINSGFWISNIALLVFWISMLAAGLIKALQDYPGASSDFNKIMNDMKPAFELFSLSGIILFTGMILLIYPLLKKIKSLL